MTDVIVGAGLVLFGVIIGAAIALTAKGSNATK